jgi:hypothetical protein
MENTNGDKRMQDAIQISDQAGAPEQTPGQTSRRVFLRRVGAAVFSALIVDATAEHAAAVCPPCGGGVSDAYCYTIPSEPGGYLIDPDANCGVSGDTDESCVSTPYPDTDANCGKGTNHTDSDAGCSDPGAATDGNCYIGGTGEHDVDVTCTAQNNHTDNACGDCNDNHDSDQHCDISGDPDNMCGHQHRSDYIDTDDTCSNHTGVSDVGCGVHDNGYLWGHPTTDVDNNCGSPLPDQNCTGDPTDSSCYQQVDSTQPDESCSASHTDKACMEEFDSDQNCNNTTESDEHCAKGLIWDEDNHCGIGGDTDNSCDRWYDIYGMPHGSPDESAP